MKIAVFGASGKTGSIIVQEALAKGHEVLAAVRTPEAYTISHPSLRTIKADVLQLEGKEVRDALKTCDSVVLALGTKELWGNTVRSLGTKNIITILKEEKVTPRVWVMSALGTGKSITQLGWFNKLISYTLLYSVLQEHDKEETIVRESGLPFTIFHATGLTNKAKTEKYVLVQEPDTVPTSTVARSDIAFAMVEHMDKSDLVNRTVCITSEK